MRIIKLSGRSATNAASLCVVCIIAPIGIALGQAAPAPEPSTAADGNNLEEIEVTGERPGPRMWRVSNGDHVVWLLGTLEPLPKRMDWRSNEVEAVLAVDAALANNQTTLAIRPIYDLLGPNGTLAALRAKGYRVEGP